MTSGGNLNPANAALGGWTGRTRYRRFTPTASRVNGLGTNPAATERGRAQRNTTGTDRTARRAALTGSGPFIPAILQRARTVQGPFSIVPMSGAVSERTLVPEGSAHEDATRRIDHAPAPT